MANNGSRLLLDHRRRSGRRALWIVALGLFVGGFFTWVLERFLPESVGKEFLTSSVVASVGPVSLDLVAFAFTLGPISFALNVLTLVGVAVVAFVARSIL